MVLLSGIEPPTSSLPMTCSTPELQQHLVRLCYLAGRKAIATLFCPLQASSAR